MSKIFRFLLINLLLVTCYLSLVTSPLFAEGEIESSQHVLYRITEDAKAHVTHQVKLTNLTTNYYASEYSLFLGFKDIADITAFDSQGPIDVSINEEENGTQIHLVFNDKIVGKGKVLSFTISYQTNEVAFRNGRIWEIDIPRIKEGPDLKDYTTSVSVPASFGSPTYIKPSTIKSDGLNFKKEDVLKGISIVFGEYQLFDFTLNYHLKNSRLYPVITEIALPPQTAYQEILLEQLIPEPLTVYIDKDGNWLAKYRLEGLQRLDVKAQGRARLSYIPDPAKTTPLENPAEYLKPQKYWEALDPAILEAAKKLKSPREIYDYVVKTLKYDFSRIEKSLPRAGAAEVLSKPASAICMEFTDLFVALARAAGIPAREVDGFAYTGNERLRPLSLVKDILHAWPEYYDSEKNLWIAVDPTWGNTSGIEYFDIFDFNHFAFVIKGHDSQYPSPAGSYKEPSDFAKKDVEVTFAKDNLFEEKESITITTDFAKQIMAGFPIKGTFTVANYGNMIFNEKSFQLSTQNLFPKIQKVNINPIPPFGKTAVNVQLASTSYFDSFATELVATLGKQEFKRKIQILPFYLVYLPWIGGGVGGIALFTTAFVAWRLRVQRHKGPGSLRGQGQESKKKGSQLPKK